jgi:DNA-binding transcriptional LysR family regulator
MTLDQLRVFVAVAEREHLTAGARALNLTPSAATAAIQALEGRHGTRLFHRVGRRLELSDSGRAFLVEARTVLGAVRAAEETLAELSGLTRGRLTVAASQTLASHWLPSILMRYATAHPGIALALAEGNTADVVRAVLAGDAELGCVEGAVDEPSLAMTPLAEDRLVVVAAPQHRLARLRAVSMADLAASRWVMRERGSGTRAVFEAALRAADGDPETLTIALTLPTNEAVCGAVVGSDCLTAVSELVARPYLQAGELVRVHHPLPKRLFALVQHKERFRSRAATAFVSLLQEEARRLTAQQNLPTYDI